jgi:hypothetical protein
MNKKCLKCGKDFEAKKDSAKFCSTSCRVMYNRKHGGSGKVKFKPVQTDVLYNLLMDKLSKVDFIPVSKPNYDAPPVRNFNDEPPMFPQSNKIVRTKDYFQKRIMQGFDTPDEHMAFVDDVNESGLSDMAKKELITNSRINQS